MTDHQPLPTPALAMLPEIQVFWDATTEGRLLLPRCDACQTVIWYPRAFCPDCGSHQVSWFQASGRGQVYSFTVNRRGAAHLGDYRGIGPYVLAYVELEEGPRVLTNIVECDPDQVTIGQPVEAVFQDTGKGAAFIRFRPLGSTR